MGWTPVYVCIGMAIFALIGWLVEATWTEGTDPWDYPEPPK